MRIPILAAFLTATLATASVADAQGRRRDRDRDGWRHRVERPQSHGTLRNAWPYGYPRTYR
jgi:hypothetical protein